MKKIHLFLLAILCIASANAQSDKFIAAMQKNLDRFDSAKTTSDYQGLAAAFERIGDAEKTEWLPYYYAALAYVTPGWSDTKLDKDANADRVKALCDRAESLAKDDADKSEIYTIRNMAATQQMMVDPQSRWASYGQESGKYLQKAKQLNPNNPRASYLEGAGIFNTPEQFGGGKAPAKPVLEKTVSLFKADQPKPLHPRWGQQQAEEMLAQCK